MRLLFLLLFTSITTFSQNRGNVWMLGNNKMSFNTPSSTLVVPSSNTPYTQSSISDINGDILIYYNGTSLFDKNNVEVYTNERFEKSLNSVLFKKIGCNNEYYLFETKTVKRPTQGALQEFHLAPKLYYSRFHVESSGEVIVLDENIPVLDSYVYSGVSVYINEQDQKVWVLARNGNVFYTIEVNERGLQPPLSNTVNGPSVLNAFVSNGSNSITRVMFNTNNEFKFSADGTKIVTYLQAKVSLNDSFEIVEKDGEIQIHDFNLETGNISNEVTIKKGNTNVEIFAPQKGEVKNNVLYAVTTIKFLPFGLPPLQGLYTYDLSSTDIKSTEQLLFSEDLAVFSGLQIAPDNEIYFMLRSERVDVNSSIGKVNETSIESILTINKEDSAGFPSFPQSYFTSHIFAKNLCFGEVVEFTSDLVDVAVNYNWSFGDGTTSTIENPTHSYSSSGNYNVSLVYETTNVDFKTVTKNIVIRDELTSTTLTDIVYKCSNEEYVELNAGLFETFLWSTGETTQIINVAEPGNYSVIVGDKNCCTSEFHVTVLENEAPLINNIEFNALENQVVVSVVGVEPLTYILDDTISQQNNVFSNLTIGSHKVKVIDANNCIATKEFEVTLEIPKFFSPNNDGVNDVFRIKQLEGNINFRFEIYDRFKRVIKVYKNEIINWDGSFNGEQLPPDDYWYYLKVNNQEFKGHFSLLK